MRLTQRPINARNTTYQGTFRNNILFPAAYVARAQRAGVESLFIETPRARVIVELEQLVPRETRGNRQNREP